MVCFRFLCVTPRANFLQTAFALHKNSGSTAIHMIMKRSAPAKIIHRVQSKLFQILITYLTKERMPFQNHQKYLNIRKDDLQKC